MNEGKQRNPIPPNIKPGPVPNPNPEPSPPAQKAQGWITYLGAAVVLGTGVFGYVKGEIPFVALLFFVGAALTIAGLRNALAKVITDLANLKG